MTKQPELQVKLREHTRRTLSEEAIAAPGLDDLIPNKTPYLEAMVHETLRYGRVAIYARRGEERSLSTSLVMKLILGSHERHRSPRVSPTTRNQPPPPYLPRLRGGAGVAPRTAQTRRTNCDPGQRVRPTISTPIGGWTKKGSSIPMPARACRSGMESGDVSARVSL